MWSNDSLGEFHKVKPAVGLVLEQPPADGETQGGIPLLPEQAAALAEHYRGEIPVLKTLRLLLTRCRREKQLSVYGTGHSVQGDARAVKNYIEVNYRRKIMIAELAELTGCKPNGFTPYFKKLTGKRFTDYVQEVRTRHALEDYLTHDIPVGEAALKNGFCHYNHFTKACRKYYGASPTEIKNQKRGKQVSLPLEIPA